MFKKLKQKWEIASNERLLIIFLVFAITGSTAAKLAEPITQLVGINKSLNPLIYWPVRILLIFPLYQILLIMFGWLFDEYNFFINFAKKILRIKS